MAETVGGTPGGIRRHVRSLYQYIKKIGQGAWDKLTEAEKKAARLKHAAKTAKPGYSRTGLLRDEAKRQDKLKQAASYSD